MSRKKSGSVYTAPISFAALNESEDELETKDVNYNISTENSHKPASNSNLTVSSMDRKKVEVVTTQEHPLAHNSSSSSLSSSEENSPKSNNIEMGKSTSSGLVPPVNTPSENQTKITGTPSKISEAIFNPKARSILFSNIKKNIHYYTGSSNTDEGQLKFTKTFNVENTTEPKEVLHSHSAEGKLLKDFKDRLKKSWEEPLKTDSSNYMGFSDKRMRSSSDSNVAKASSEPRTSISQSPAVKDNTAMSFSQLLAARQMKKDDTISIRSHYSEEFINDLKPSKSESDSNISQASDNIIRKPSEMKLSQTKLSLSSITTIAADPSQDVSLNVVAVLSIIMFLLFTLPLPPIILIYIKAFACGVIFAVGFLCIFAASTQFKPVQIERPYINCSTPYKIPLSVYDPDKSFKGWMNELSQYNPDTYHVSATQSVYVTLEKTTLRLQTPKKNIARRETYDEERVAISNVVYQRILDIKEAKVYLVPPGLVKKRVWSKKYPICLELPNSKQNKLKHSTSSYSHQSNDPNSNNEEDESSNSEKIYLFGRTQRQKEEWFYRLQQAILIAAWNAQDALKKDEDDEAEILSPDPDENPKIVKKIKSPLAEFREYYLYICRLLPDPGLYTTPKSDIKNWTPAKVPTSSSSSTTAVHFSSSVQSSPVVLSQPRNQNTNPGPDEPGLEVAWFNVMIGRIMFDFLRSQKWAKWVSIKIQKKLDKIKLPYFINGLQLTDIDLGMTVPIIHKVSLPRIDEKGVWLDMEITYNGSVQLTLETKCVLTKLGKQNEEEMVERGASHDRSAITNSDEEDSAESSDEEESAVSRLVNQVQNVVATVGPTEGALATPIHYLTTSSSDNQITPKKSKNNDKLSSSPRSETYVQPNLPMNSAPQGQPQGKRWMRIVDSIAKNKYFQKATESKYIRRKLETVSNTPLVLTAELQQLHGTMCVNIPPPPTDRIWYGFKECPFLVLKAHPKFGERAVTMTHATDWIAKKLKQEFNKLLVMPNMEDIPIPVMFNNITPTT